MTPIREAPKRNAIVPSVWASFYEDTHVPAAVMVGHTLYVTGHTGEGADGTFPSNPEAQIRGTFANIALTLAEAGMTWSDVVEVTTYHIGLRDQMGTLLAVAAEYLGVPFPAWTAVGVTELWPPDAVVEISCIAVPRRTSGQVRARWQRRARRAPAMARDSGTRDQPAGGPRQGRTSDAVQGCP